MKNILFVDDEPNILSGLRRVFRCERNEWEMTFVDSAAAALAILEVQPVDILITDMKMPGRTGADLLEIAHKRYPHIMRIVLSGYSELEDSLRSVFISHQFLSKPYDAETLKQVIVRAGHLGAMLGDEQLRETVGSIEQIPVLPAVYRDLVTAMARDEDVNDLAEIVMRDQGLSLSIIRFVNSGLFGLRESITDLPHAIAHIGLKTLSNLVLSLKVFSKFEESPIANGFSVASEQDHSARTAQLASRMLTRIEKPEDVYLASMLHDVGKLVFATKLRDRYESALNQSREEGISQLQAEFEEFGVTHAEVGAYLLSLWGLPYRIVEAVAFHHNPMALEEPWSFDICAAIHIADVLTHEADSPDDEESELDDFWLEEIGVLDQIEEWRAIARSLKEAGELVSP